MIASRLLSGPLPLLLCLLAGGCAYLYFLNRYLIEIKDRGRKFPVIVFTLVAIVAGSTVFAALAAGTPWMVAPAIVLAVAFAGEARRIAIRRRSAGEPPVAQSQPGISLAHPVTTTDLAVLRYEIARPEWDGRDLRIAHVSDFHANHRLPTEYYEAAMQRIAEARPDFLFLTGDFVSKRSFVPLLPQFLSTARGRLGTIAVLGNHDYWVGGDAVKDALKSAGVTWLGDGCLQYELTGATGWTSRVRVCGCEKPWGPGECPAQPAEADELLLVLTHTPDNIYQLSGPGIAAVFAGHYHAGQIRLPLLGSLVVPSAYGRLFDQGHFVVNGTHLFVTAGVGAAIPPFRLYCRPDVLIVDIRGRSSV